jgi:hypothetical protein
MQFIESSIVGVRSSVLTLACHATPMRFMLFPMVHVAERSFYDEVTRRLRRCDLIVAEGGPAGVAPVQEWTARIRVDGMVDQIVALDLEHLGVPVIWEFTPRPPASGAERLARAAGDTVGAAALRLLGRYSGSRDLPSIDEAEAHDDRWLGGRADRWVQDRMLDRRDDALTRVLTSVHRERGDRPETMAVVYGAAHMPAVVEHLRSELGYRVKDAEWLTVVNAPG